MPDVALWLLAFNILTFSLPEFSYETVKLPKVESSQSRKGVMDMPVKIILNEKKMNKNSLFAS